MVAYCNCMTKSENPRYIKRMLVVDYFLGMMPKSQLYSVLHLDFIMKNIFVIGNYGNKNIGDEILLKGLIKKYNNTSGNKFFVAVRNVGFVDTYHKEIKKSIIPVSVYNHVELGRCFLKCETVLIGGGGIWGAYMGKLAHFIPLAAIIGKILLKKVYFESIGIYTTAPNFDKFFVNIGILFSNYCSVRDHESFRNLWKINKKKSRVVDDLAIYLLRDHNIDLNQFPIIPEYDFIVKVKQEKKMLLGLSLVSVHDESTRLQIIRELSKAINFLNSKYDNFFVIFFPFAKAPEKSSDILMAEELIKNLTRKENFIVLTHANPLSWYSIIKNFIDVFIGMRYHSIVFASKADKPILCLPYENKVLEYLQTYKGRKIENIPMKNISSQSIIDFVEKTGLLNQ
jgi:polysaccharide pyruvyl transferase WcaK-like protein